MIEYEKGCPKRINHFLKVNSFAKIIAEAENISQKQKEILEVATIVHDIGIKPSLEKYNSSAGKYQQIEGPQVAEKLLKELEFSQETIDRVCFLVANHHNYEKVDDVDYQILIEADFLINIFEDGLDTETALKIKENHFKTESGKRILDALYNSEKEKIQ